MKAIDVKLEELVSFTEGYLSLQGRRLVIHDIHAFAQFRKDLIDMVGSKQARRIITRFGYFWGQADAAAMKRVYRWDNIDELIKAGPRLQALQGATKSAIKSLSIDTGSGKFEMEIIWHDSGEAHEHNIEFGKTDYPACWLLSGYASGYSSFCMGKNVYFIERECTAKGDRVCYAVGKDIDSWDKDVVKDLQFFQSDDIEGKILNLTRELKEKNFELAIQRKKLDLLNPVRKPFFIEVHSEPFKKVIDLAGRIAPFDSSVLITGETGVGKEVIAKYIHQLSPRAESSFIAVNCGALPESLVESELFGHKAGAFTGAVQSRIGLFEQAEKGTIFLDEIGDISTGIQIKILRALQEKEILRIGENKPRKIDVRIIAATNRNLEKAIADGNFRDDLYYRLCVIEIHIPPLRERKEDILPLARFFVKKFAKRLKIAHLRLDASCAKYLLDYQWPGNIRELENSIERAAVLCKDGLILPENFPPYIIGTASYKLFENPLSVPLARLEQEHIKNVLDLVGGSKSRAADILGISPATLWRKLKSYSCQ